MTACGGEELGTTQAWLSSSLIAEQAAATTDAAREGVANKRAQALIEAMTLDQKLQQLTGAVPEIVPELPNCKGARHVSGIAALGIPTFRVTSGPVGLGQNDCVSASIPPVYANVGSDRIDITAYTHASSAKATALPSAMAAAASFDPGVAASYGDLIGTGMLNLALHVFEAPGMNLNRLPVLGRNFEYFGEDPYLSGVMSVAEIKAIQAKGLIGMAKHFVANEQETNRTTIQETVDRQVLRELYLLPFEMSVKDGAVASIMCACNYVNGLSSCAHKEHMTDSVAGSEVLQVYLSFPNGSTAYAGGAAQPPKRLVGFKKVDLAPGAAQEVTITIDPAASNHPLSFWNKAYNAWISPAGSYTLHVGNSSSPKDLAAFTFTK